MCRGATRLSPAIQGRSVRRARPPHEKLDRAFQKYYPDVTIDLPPPYAGSLGAIELIKGDLDFVMVSRELKPTDLSDFRKKFGYDPFSTPISVARGGILGFSMRWAFSCMRTTRSANFPSRSSTRSIRRPAIAAARRSPPGASSG